MPATIRLRRMGRRKKPFHRIVVADSRSPRDGKFIEIVGHYDPLPTPAEIVVDKEKVIDWLRKGATLSPSVKSLLRQVGIMETWRLVRTGKSLEELGHIEDEYRQKMSIRSHARVEAKAAKKAEKKAAEAEEAEEETEARAEEPEAEEAKADEPEAAEPEAEKSEPAEKKPKTDEAKPKAEEAKPEAEEAKPEEADAASPEDAPQEEEKKEPSGE